MHLMETYSSAGKHHRLEQQQSNLPLASILGAYNIHKLLPIQNRHVRVHEVEVSIQKGCAQWLFRERQCTLLP